MSKEEIVAALPRRTAHALHALLELEKHPVTQIPTAAEVMLYDMEADSPRGTAAALRHAAKLGYAMRVPPAYWTATFSGLELRRALEDRYLRETD